MEIAKELFKTGFDTGFMAGFGVAIGLITREREDLIVVIGENPTVAKLISALACSILLKGFVSQKAPDAVGEETLNAVIQEIESAMKLSQEMES